MAGTREKLKGLFRKGTGSQRRQSRHQDNPPETSITPAGPSTTGSNPAQQEESRDSLISSSPAIQQKLPATQSLWDRAYDALAKEKPELVKEYDKLLAKDEQMANSDATPSHLSASHSIDCRPESSPRQIQLKNVIKNGLQRMEDNKATYNIGGHEFVLADQITQAAKLLLWAKDWVGSAIKDSPEASMAWSGVCLILPLLTNPTTAAEANRDGFAYVTSRMRYYVALEPLLRRLSQNARVDEALVSEANDHIADLYQAILDFQLSSVLRFYQSCLKTYVHDIVPSKDWKQIRLDIKAQEETINKDLGQINELAARQELELLNKTSEDTRAIMEDHLSVATQQLTALKEQLAVHKDAAQQKLLDKQHTCLQLFCLAGNGKDAMYDWYKDRVELRVQGTCKWFLQHENFQKWLSQESGPLLVSADPGCGKSVLAKYLIDHGLAPQSATICYFFFKDQDQNTVRQALCALLHQLFSQKLALIRHAMDLHRTMGSALIQSETSLWAILRDAVRDPQAGPVIFVMDALDECADSELSSLITNLEELFCDEQLSNAKFKVLMTSRPYEHVVNEFYGLLDVFPRIRIPGEEEFETISQEINSVIHHRVKQLAKKQRLSDEIKSAVENKLLAINHRTYLWVYLVFAYLDTGFKKTQKGIADAIQALPQSVNQAYDQILDRSKEKETLKKALSIVLAARRPLTLSEMNIAMNISGQGRSIYDLDLEQEVDFKSRLRTLCGLFVSIHHDKVYFLHQTAREFLTQSSAPTAVSSGLRWHRSITIRHAHSVLAEICVFYLDMLNLADTKTIRQDDHHGALLEYSANYWGDHFHEAEFEKDSLMVHLASGLCGLVSTSHLLWVDILSSQYEMPDAFKGVLVASHFGLIHVAEVLLNRGADIMAKDSDGMTALMFAAFNSHETVARLLLDNRIDVEAKDSNGSTALIFAANNGHKAVTQLLLDNDADVEAKDNKGRTALIYAAGSGHETVTQMLLDKSADVESKDNKGRTALIYAAASGHAAIARLLLDKSADIEVKDEERGTALIYAAGCGHEAITRLLLDKGVDVGAKDDEGKTALMYAAKAGHEAIAQLLLSNGADVEAKDDEGKTASMLAADSGQEAVRQLLLDKAGAEAEVKD